MKLPLRSDSVHHHRLVAGISCCLRDKFPSLQNQKTYRGDCAGGVTDARDNAGGVTGAGWQVAAKLREGFCGIALDRIQS